MYWVQEFVIELPQFRYVEKMFLHIKSLSASLGVLWEGKFIATCEKEYVDVVVIEEHVLSLET